MKKKYFFGSLTRHQFTSENLSKPPDFSLQQQGSNIDQSDQSSNGGKGSEATRGMGATNERREGPGNDDELKGRTVRTEALPRWSHDPKHQAAKGGPEQVWAGDLGYDAGGDSIWW